jgi:hypothetical protein
MMSPMSLRSKRVSFTPASFSKSATFGIDLIDEIIRPFLAVVRDVFPEFTRSAPACGRRPMRGIYTALLSAPLAETGLRASQRARGPRPLLVRRNKAREII